MMSQELCYVLRGWIGGILSEFFGICVSLSQVDVAD